jgi:oxygen-independent coproporphyrinogen-3 oxidase
MRGVDLSGIAAQSGEEAVRRHEVTIKGFVENGLLERRDSAVRLTPRGRLLSNEVFQRFISPTEVPASVAVSEL